MATIGGRPIPDWALYAGAGVVVGGGYFLYKKRKAAASTATPATSGGAAAPVPSTAYSDTSSGQQSSIVPYYLTGNQGSQGSYGIGSLSGSTPLPTPSGTPAGPTASGSTSDQNAAVLPPIPPLLPVTPPSPTSVAPPPPVPSTAAPTPAPAPQQNNNIPPDLMQKITANGERIIGGIPSPNGGMWWLGSKGGVFAINAPFYGAPAGQSYFTGVHGTPAGIVPFGSGYEVINSIGETYKYGG